MSNINTVILEDELEEVISAGAVKTGPVIKITEGISILESTGALLLDKQLYSAEKVLLILENSQAIKEALKQVRIKNAIKALGVSSKEELLEYLKGT